jgi:hypothetical protein
MIKKTMRHMYSNLTQSYLFYGAILLGSVFLVYVWWYSHRSDLRSTQKYILTPEIIQTVTQDREIPHDIWQELQEETSKAINLLTPGEPRLTM